MDTNQKSKQDQNKPGSMLTQKTNEDFNKKQPDPRDPNEIKDEAKPEVEVPDLGVKKEGKPDDIIMNDDANNDDQEETTEFIEEGEPEVFDNKAEEVKK